MAQFSVFQMVQFHQIDQNSQKSMMLGAEIWYL